MSQSRTPILDARIASGMTAEEAYRAADALIRENPPLRTPELSRRLIGAHDEFADPGYVDAILRNMAALPIRTVYSDRRLPALAGPGAAECPGTVAEVAGGIVALSRTLDAELSESDAARVPAPLLDDLENRVAAFLSPFDDILERCEDAFPGIAHARIAAQLGAGSYRAFARRLGLPPTAATSLLLRYSVMPARCYLRGIRRLGISCPASALRQGWLLCTLLDYPNSDEPATRAAQFSRMSRLVFSPLARAGERAGIVQPARAAQVPTLF